MKLYHTIGFNLDCALDNLGPKIWGPTNPKFDAIFDNFKVQMRIFPERIKSRTKSENWLLDIGFCHVRWKKSDELWSTNNGDRLFSTFSCVLIFLHALENDQGLLAHTSPGRWFPFQKKIMPWGQNRLKFSVLALLTLGRWGVTARNFYDTCYEAMIRIWLQRLGARPSFKIWERKKRPKLGVISNNFRHRSHIYLQKKIQILTIGNNRQRQSAILPAFNNKKSELMLMRRTRT